MAKNIVTLDLDNTSYEIRPYGVCSTAGNTRAKTVSISGFTLCVGATVLVKFENTNTVVNPTLNVNGTGAKAIVWNNSASFGQQLILENEIYEFRYNDTNWVVISSPLVKDFRKNGWYSFTPYLYDSDTKLLYNYYTKIANIGTPIDCTLRFRIYEDINYASYGEWVLRLNHATSFGRNVTLSQAAGSNKKFWVYIDSNFDVWVKSDIEWTSSIEFCVEKDSTAGRTLILEGWTQSISEPSNIIHSISNSGTVRISPDDSTNLTIAPVYDYNANVNLANGAKGSIPYQSAKDTTTMLGIGSNGQFLSVSNGVPAWVANPNSDTKNTAGSTDSTSKLYLIGATSQAANPQTYSNSTVYATNGTLYCKGLTSTNGDISLYTDSGDSPSLVFRRGTIADSMVDWKMFVTGGVLKIQSSTDSVNNGAWKDIFSFSTNSSSNITSAYNITAPKFIGALQGDVSGYSKALSPLTVQSNNVFTRAHTNSIKYDYTIPNTHENLMSGSTGYNNAIITIPRYANSEKYNSYLGFTGNGMYLASRNNDTNWAWERIITSENYTSYTVKKDGTGATGTWSINVTGSSGSCTGNAATATCIQRPGAIATELPTGTTVCSNGMKFVRSMSTTTNKPTNATYGNVIQIGGDGHSQLFLEWSGNTTATTGKVYYKSKRDVATTEWGNWVQLIDERDEVTTSKAGLMSVADKSKLDAVDSTYLKLTGGQISSSATTPLSINSTSGTESGLRFDINKVSSGWVGYNPTNGIHLFSYKGGNTILGIKDDGTPHFSGNTLLHGANYTNYTVKKDGTGATGTWPISITGNAASTTNAEKLGNVSASSYALKTDIPVYKKAITTGFIDAFRTQAFGSTGSTNGSISVIRCDTAGVDKAPQYGTGLAIAKGDTHTYLYADYASGLVYMGAGNQDKLNWVKRVQFTDGTAASGTWPISVTGNAATATTATKSNNIAGGAQGSIPYQTAANTTTFLAKGVDGYTLRMNSNATAPVWVSPYATSSTAGGFILGTTVTADAQNTARKYEVKLESSGHAYVNVPWTDNDTKYTHPTDGANTGSFGPSANASPAHGGTFSVPYITVNNKGHVTAVSTKTITLPADSNTDTKVKQTAKSDNVAYPLLLGPSSHTSGNAAEAYYDSGVTLNPSTNTIAANVSGSSGSCTGNAATATCIKKPGSYISALPTSTTTLTAGMTMGLVGSSTTNKPTNATYGNVIQIGGTGHSQLFLEWSGSNTATTGYIYYNSKRDLEATAWGGWKRILDERDLLTAVTQAEIESLF